MEENFRRKFVMRHLNICLENKKELNEWELGFVESISEIINVYSIMPEYISERQYNRLKEIAEKFL